MASSAAPPSASDPGRYVTDALVLLGIGVSLGLIAVSAMLNFRVGFRTADTELDGWVYGLGMGGADILKAMCPFVASWGRRHKDWLAATAAAAVFVVVTGYSLSAGYGFAAQHRVFKQGERTTAKEQRGDTRKDIDRIEKRLTQLGVQRSEGEITKTIAVTLAKPVTEKGRSVDEVSKGCTLNRSTTREACAEIAALNEEAERAREYHRLVNESRELRSTLGKSNAGAANGSADPQVDALEKLLQWVGASRDGIEVGLSALVGLVVEVGSGLGLYIATTPWRGREGAKTKRTKQKRGRTKSRTSVMMTVEKEETLGAVADFMLERLEPKTGSELSAGDIYLAYKRWCREKGAVPLKRHDLLIEFAAFATKAGIPFSGTNGRGVYRDVTLTV